MKKKMSISILLCLTLVTSLLAFFGCGLLSNKQVPVYQGMSITPVVSSAEAKTYFGDGKDDFDYDKDNGNHNGHFKGDHADKNEDIDGENPFPENDLGENIEEEIRDTLDVVGASSGIYYATPNEDIYINILIDNPDNFEILSFTLNGQKYSSYMFEDGSNMEKIVLKYNVGYTSGIVEYTIDAIKYVDGTEIKDVTIGGNKTVKAGIRTDGQVSVDLSRADADVSSISLDVSVTDADSLISHSGGFIKAVLYNGTSIVAYKDVALGENEIVFDSLETNTLYQYAVVGYYDDLSGDGRKMIIFHKGALYTDAVVLFDNITVGKGGVEFGFLWNDGHPTKSLTALKLYKDGALLDTLDVTATAVEELVSNNAYTLVAEYDNAGKSESIKLDFTTVGKAEPSFEIADARLTSDGIKGSVTVTDDDETLLDYTVGIYRDNTLVKESKSGEIDFSGLESYTEYDLKITYAFDLDDGSYSQTNIYKYTFKTHPFIDVLSCDIINTGTISEGDTIYMQLNLNNPDDVRVESVIIGDAEYAVTGSSTKTKIYVEILHNGQFTGGDTNFQVDKINVRADNESLTVTPASILSDSIFINGTIKVLGVRIVNSDFEPIDWAFPTESVYALLTLDNPTGYNIDSVNTYFENLTRLDDNRWYYPLSNASGQIVHTLTGISYHNEYVSETLTINNIATQSCFIVSSDTVNYISNPDELKNLSDGGYYELTGDIDLSGIGWEAKSFSGVLDAKGYSVKNMSYVGSVKNRHAYFGLFSTATGVIMNLNIESATIIADVSADDNGRYFAYCGAIAGSTSVFGDLTISNCTVDEDTAISVSNRAGDSFVGGLLGACDNSSVAVTACENRASVSAVSNLSAVAGGLIGRNGGISASVIVTNSANYGDVTASGDAQVRVGGILAYTEYETYLTVDSCINTACVLAKSGETIYVGGILGYSAAYAHLNITSALHAGIVHSDVLYQCIGGIIGHSYYSTELMLEDVYSVTLGSGTGGTLCTAEQLGNADFYTDTLGWSEDVWDLTEIDIENGKYPTLK